MNFVTDIDSQVTSVVVELLKRDECFRLQTSVNGYPASLVIDINDNTGDDGASLKVQGFRLSSKSSAKLSLILIPVDKGEEYAHLPHPRRCGLRSYKRRSAGLGLVPCTSSESSGDIAKGDFTQDAFQHLLDGQFRGIQLYGVSRRFERGYRTLGVTLIARTNLI